MKLIAISLLCMLLSTGNAGALTGAWNGELTIGTAKLKLVFNFSEDPTGATLCSIDSPYQGAVGIPATVSLCTADSISVDCSAIGATYAGTVSSEAITGVFSQRGYSFPLNLAPETPVEDRRPQTPRPPFPYTAVDTTFTATDGAVLSATLTLPLSSDSRKIPIVIMVTGSGPQNRDEEIFDHKPFAVIADHLARNGIGSLRYDDRGTGKSTGDFFSATTETFKGDAAAGIAFLRTLPQAGKVGVLGHSEGGTISFMLGADGIPDFIISLAGMATSGKETLIMQNSHALDRTALSETDKASTLRLIGLLFDDMAEQGRNHISGPIDIDSIIGASGLTVNPAIVASLKMTSEKMRTPWYDAFLGLNPRDFLSSIKCPLLAINGDKDTQVDASTNLAVIKELIPHADIRLLPGLNHLMQHCATGESSEYGEITETIAPEVLDLISAFILQ